MEQGGVVVWAEVMRANGRNGELTGASDKITAGAGLSLAGWGAWAQAGGLSLSLQIRLARGGDASDDL